jgi:hypothetical protein
MGQRFSRVMPRESVLFTLEKDLIHVHQVRDRKDAYLN